jgi:hypothetical protein
MTAVRQRSSWSIVRFPQEGALIFAVLLWAGFFVLVLVLTMAIAIFGSVTTSVWEQATQVPRWFAFGTGIWLTGVYLRLHVAHGKTRREFMRQTSVYMVVFATLLAVLTTLGYLLERGVYAIGGWPQAFSREYLFHAADDVGPILLSYLLVFLAWTATGAVVAAGYRRIAGVGLALTVPLGIVLIGLVEIALRSRYFAPLTIVDVEVAVSLPVAAALGAGAFLVGVGTTWALVRDVPLSREAV